MNELAMTLVGSADVPDADRARRLAAVYRLLLDLASRREETEYPAEATHAEPLAPNRRESHERSAAK